ncbi:MAG: ATPase with chaperone activity [Hyphomicrobiales bacterium]|nr:MAG: ATPase with chaperone activity [Hyphomicrobiales bacterium]
MDDFNQIEVPPSFIALFTSPSGHRLTEPMSEVRRRYELCEDLAQMLTDQASTAAFKTGEPERDVLAKMRAALTAEGSPVAPAEAGWVVTRLAELLGWEAPPRE